MSKLYTGIGSRETPQDILNLFIGVGKYLAEQGHTLRSGGANGSDKAFELGAMSVGGNMEIYIPWWGFQGSNSPLVLKDAKAYEIAKQYHPYWDNLSQGAKKLQARNSHQVLGLDLETPTNAIICWTPKGKGSGGTGQAIRIAKAYNIPIFDAGAYKNVSEVRQKLWEFLMEAGFTNYEQ